MTEKEFTSTIEPKVKAVGFIFVERCNCGGVLQYWYKHPSTTKRLGIKPNQNMWGVHTTHKGNAIARGGITAPSNDLKAALKTHYNLELEV